MSVRREENECEEGGKEGGDTSNKCEERGYDKCEEGGEISVKREEK